MLLVTKMSSTSNCNVTFFEISSQFFADDIICISISTLFSWLHGPKPIGQEPANSVRGPGRTRTWTIKNYNFSDHFGPSGPLIPAFSNMFVLKLSLKPILVIKQCEKRVGHFLHSSWRWLILSCSSFFHFICTRKNLSNGFSEVFFVNSQAQVNFQKFQNWHFSRLNLIVHGTLIDSAWTVQSVLKRGGWTNVLTLYLVVFFNISVVILTLVAMAFDRYCTVVPNIMTKTVNKHRNKRWFIFGVSYFNTQNSFSHKS